MIRTTLNISASTFIDSKRFKTKFKRVVDGIGAEVATEMTPYAQSIFAPPGPVARPIQWTTEKQRRAFFATNGFGKGIPTKRTNKVGRAWKVIYTPKPEGGTFALNNPVPYARYVYGGFQAGNIYQQRFHVNTGWANAIQQRSVIFTELSKRLQTKFNEALRGFGLVEVGKI